MSVKICSVCNTEKPIEEFSIRNRLMRDGVTVKQYRKSQCLECMRIQRRDWGKKNPHKIREYTTCENKSFLTAKRRATKKNATPFWADLEAIRQIYLECQKVSEETGIKHEVDHIIPLQGKNVSGLHVHYNLQILPAEQNRQKSNKY